MNAQCPCPIHLVHTPLASGLRAVALPDRDAPLIPALGGGSETQPLRPQDRYVGQRIWIECSR